MAPLYGLTEAEIRIVDDAALDAPTAGIEQIRSQAARGMVVSAPRMFDMPIWHLKTPQRT
jgi:hypothetical protein